MSTHAAIAIKKSSECIRWIYLHWDGDLNFAGRTLANHYLTIDCAIARGIRKRQSNNQRSCRTYGWFLRLPV